LSRNETDTVHYDTRSPLKENLDGIKVNLGSSLEYSDVENENED
jgi:hypothetical protein